ncbi:MAG: glycosyl transferase family 1 [Pseudomonadota bacterium]
MTKLAFFGHNVADAAIRRRVEAFQADGIEVQAYMARRGPAAQPDWKWVDLGETRDGAFVQRIRSVFRSADVAADDEDLASADVIYARNLDMLATAFLAKRKRKLAAPVIYECLDVHRLMVRKDPIGMALRIIERALLKRSRALVVSSPGFLKNYFEPRHGGLYEAFLVENRLAEGMDYGARPVARAHDASAPLRLGWVGVLRCGRSFQLLCQLADAFPDRLEIHLHGKPAHNEIDAFDANVAARANMTYHGPYKAPEDLGRIYDSIDVVWAGDFMEAGYNSVWLLPNRIYEGGYYTTAPIAPAGTQTAAWIDTHKTGLLVAEPLEKTLPEAVSALIRNRKPLEEAETRLRALPDTVFIQPKGEMEKLLSAALVSSKAEVTA